MYDPYFDHLWHYITPIRTCHGRCPQHLRTQFFHQAALLGETPPNHAKLAPASVEPVGAKLSMTGYRPQLFMEKLHQGSLDALLHSQFAKKWNLSLQVEGKLTQLQEEILCGSSFAVSNSSSWDQKGAAVWFIGGVNKEQ